MSQVRPHAKTALYGTTIILGHLPILMLHAVAHSRLEIFLSGLANLYVGLVILLAPLVSLLLLWTARQKVGLWLLFLSMLGSFLFGGYNHFVASSPDHVSQVPAGNWGTIFTQTAIAMAIIEAAGALMGLAALRASDTALETQQPA